MIEFIVGFIAGAGVVIAGLYIAASRVEAEEERQQALLQQQKEQQAKEAYEKYLKWTEYGEPY